MFTFFKEVYEAGADFAEKTIPAWMNKTRRGGAMEEGDRKQLAGTIGIGFGDLLEKTGYLGMGLTLLFAVGAGVTGGLTIPALLAFGAIGTALAGAGTFGMGMKKGGDNNCGLISIGREFRRSLGSAMWSDLRNSLKKGKAADFNAAAEPSQDAAPKPVPAPEGAPKTVIAPAPAAAPKNNP